MFADLLPAALAAVLLMGLSKSGFANGFGAFATPLMALAMPITQAAVVMLPLLLVMDLVSVYSLRKSVDGAVLRHCLPAGLCGVLLGWLLGWPEVRPLLLPPLLPPLPPPLPPRGSACAPTRPR